MMHILAPIDNIRFDIEEALDKQTYATVPLPFPGIDKSSAPICEFFLRSQCSKGNLCQFRHIKGEKTVLCKHWLRGLCKKGDDCEFLHEYDTSKMPECFFYSKFAQCGNKECEYLHLDPEAKIKDCPWYDRGFCRHGPLCKNRHNRKILCKNYLCGFCPDGLICKFKHPRFDLPTPDIMTQQKKQLFYCDYCGEYGHKITSCFKLNPENRVAYQMKLQQQSQNRQQQQQQHQQNQQQYLQQQQQHHQQHHQQQQQAHHNDHEHQPQQQQQPQQRRYNYNYSNNYSTGGMTHPEVTCFKCGEKGHYANRCNKSAFAFLRGPVGPQTTDQQK